MKLSALAMFFVLACVPAHSNPPRTPWRVEVTTSGGITGRGNGDVAVASDGKVTIRTMDGKTCAFDATDEERAQFTTLLADARPDTWDAAYIPEERCCDRIEYVLTVDEAGVQRKTAWIDDPLPRPRDLAALGDALIALRGSYLEQCR